MATVRVSLLLAGERLHRRLNRSVLSDVPAEATRLNRAGRDHKIIRLWGLSHARQYGTDQAVFLCRGRTRAVISPSPSAHHLERVIARRPANPALRPTRAMRLPFACTDYRPARPAQLLPSACSYRRFVDRCQTALSFLSLRQIDPILAKLQWPFGEPAPAAEPACVSRSRVDQGDCTSSSNEKENCDDRRCISRSPYFQKASHVLFGQPWSIIAQTNF